MTEITDADRELCIEILNPCSTTAEQIRHGQAYTWEVEQCARHREASTAELRAENERLREALEQIGIYGCGMLNQPAALNISEAGWLKQRVFEMEKTARKALGGQHD